jgi:PhnB protein
LTPRSAFSFEFQPVKTEIVTSIQPELWIERAGAAIAFYQQAFGASVVHIVGEGDDVVAQLAIGAAMFWVAAASPEVGRLDPLSVGGGTGRFLLVGEDPDAVAREAVAAGATEKSPPSDEHGWRISRILDPFGHEWEVAKPLGEWPPNPRGSRDP